MPRPPERSSIDRSDRAWRSSPLRSRRPRSVLGPQQWARYRAPRFTRPVRVVWTIGILLLPVFLVWAALVQLLMAEGHARAGFAIFLFPMVPLTPLLVRAMRDLWGWER